MNNPKKNEEGYTDLTAYYGTKDIIREEAEIEQKNRELIHTFRLLAGLSGIEIIGRITLKHKKTGRVYK